MDAWHPVTPLLMRRLVEHVETRGGTSAKAKHQATTIAEIAADAGVTERTFYRYFPSKEHILFSDYDARLDWFRTALRVRPPREPITVSVRAAAESFPYNEALPQIAQLRAGHPDRDVVNAHLHRVQAGFADEIEQHLVRNTERGGEPATDAALRARLQAHCISAAMFGALDTWLNTADHRITELERLIDLALHIINDGIR
ncbi:TetR family transcriptional regulator [Nocardia sp. NPDC050630]|uniref:TetR family transcriptional regulator n=1 Tax=Nocardia sp. NPDC050630 TaxID=3364321 RepID=UPI0037B249BA